jgi:uncharacterized protein
MIIHLPDSDEIYALHQKYAPNKEILDEVWQHCKIVSRLALDIAYKRSDVDYELVESGSLLHDIGVYRLYDENGIAWPNYITHGMKGYDLLHEEGLGEVLARFAMLHTAVGISKEEYEHEKLPMIPRNNFAETTEEKIVLYADKFHSKSPRNVFNSVEWYTEHVRIFGDEFPLMFEDEVEEFGRPNIEALAAEYHLPIR